MEEKRRIFIYYFCTFFILIQMLIFVIKTKALQLNKLLWGKVIFINDVVTKLWPEVIVSYISYKIRRFWKEVNKKNKNKNK